MSVTNSSLESSIEDAYKKHETAFELDPIEVQPMNIGTSSSEESEDYQEKKSPRTILQENREKYFNMQKFGNDHYRTRN
jgi:hypothetical protein